MQTSCGELIDCLLGLLAIKPEYIVPFDIRLDAAMPSTPQEILTDRAINFSLGTGSFR